MKHHHCTCSQCCPPKPATHAGILLPRIIASGRTWLRRQSLTLQVEGLPPCITPPLTLTSVSPCGEPRWESLCDNYPLHYRVTVPILCQVRDACGCLHTGHASLCAEITLSPCVPLPECWRSSMMVIPCVRLLCAACAQDPCFDVQLELLLEAYLLRWEPCLAPAPCKPQCHDLPLYPQPYVP